MSCKYSVEDFMRIETIRSSNVSCDGSRIVFLSVGSGLVAAHSIPVKGPEAGKRRVEIDHDQSIGNAFVLSDGRQLFEADFGGDELTQIYLSSKEGRLALTKRDSRCHLIKVDPNEEWVYLLSSERDPRAFDAVRVNLKTPSVKETLYVNDDAMVLEDISDDGRFLAFSKKIRPRQKSTFIYDRTTGDMNPVGDTQSLVSEIEGRVHFGPDHGLYVRDWSERDFHAIKVYNPKTKSLRIVHEEQWDLDLFQTSRSGRYHAYVAIEDSNVSLRVYDNQAQVLLDLGPATNLFVRSLSFFPDESKIALTANNSTSPSNVYTLDLETKELTKWTDTGRDIIQEEDLAPTVSTSFKSFDGVEVPAFYLAPKSDRPLPAVFIAHGGPGGQSLRGWEPMRQLLVQNNFAVIFVNNRGSSGYGKRFLRLDTRRHGRDDLDDYVSALAHFAALGLVDPERSAIMGGSYGGYLTMAALCFRPMIFRCGVNIVGITNWVRILKSIPPWWSDFAEDYYEYIGHPEKESDYLNSISPLFHVNAIVRPFLVLQGANDPRVLRVESDDIVEAARKNGVGVEYILFEDEGHGFSKRKNQLTANSAVLRFLKKQLAHG